MTSILSIATSGMAAAQKRLEVSARNVANVSTDLPADAPSDVAAAFAALRPPLRIDQVEVSGGGTAAVVSQAPPGTQVDLANEAVQLMVARYTFAANAKVAKLAGEMQRSLLDIKT
jgi:flagellar basal-body rod protein FlgC